MARESTNGYAPVEGGELYYEVAGEGEPLILVHAGVSDHTMWDGQVKVFSPYYQVIRYDLRGFGKTTALAGGEGTAYLLGKDLLGLFQHLGLARASVLGLSLGGSVAVDFTLENPDKVKALIPVASGLSGSNLKPSAKEAGIIEEMQKSGERREFEKMAQIWAKFWVDGPLRPPDSGRDKLRNRIIPPKPSFVEVPSAAGRLDEIKAPTLVIWGDQDVTTVQGGCERLVKEVPGAEKVIFEDTAHMVNWEQPEKFNRVVLDFLQRHI